MLKMISFGKVTNFVLTFLYLINLVRAISQRCLRPFNDSDCHGAPTTVFFYYKPGSRCDIGTWRGCPTENKFPDEAKCSDICIGKLHLQIHPSMHAPTHEQLDKPTRATEKITRLHREKNLTEFRCDYTYLKSIKYYVKYHALPAPWQEARLQCSMEGATLASPYEDRIQDEMFAIAKSKNNGRIIYTGIHSKFSRGDMNSIEGKSLWEINRNINIQWDVIKTDNSVENDENSVDNKGCVAMNSRNKKFLNVNCNITYPYICYKHELALTHESHDNKECGTNDPEYKFNADTGSCYKFHRHPRTWKRAYMTCNAEGGYLAVINSDNEASTLTNLFNTFIKTASGTYKKDYILIGFYDWDHHGEWRTVHGETLFEAGFDKFLSNDYPKNETGRNFCGAFVKGKKFLLDVVCDQRSIFVCEKEPYSICSRFDKTPVPKSVKQDY